MTTLPRGAACVAILMAAYSSSSNGRLRSADPKPVHLRANVVQWQSSAAAQVERRVVPLQQYAAAQAVASNPLRNAYFGDLHVHTSWSFDAYASGTRIDPRVAYRYGQGERVTLSGGVQTQLKVPLDFMAVTDHDTSFSDIPLCIDPTDTAYGSTACREMGIGPSASGAETVPEPCFADISECSSRATRHKEMLRVNNIWYHVQKNADEFYRPGSFTTFAAYEFTSSIQGMLHRNVIFRGGRLPATILRSTDVKGLPERLWEWLERECTGDCQVLAIPHNTNWNQGIMLAPTNTDGSPFTRAGVERRAKAEPLIELHQIKGNSECATGLGTTDEDCNFELVLPPCPPGREGKNSGGMPTCAVPGQFARNALKLGLQVEQQVGANPFKYGFIGSTDTHSGTPGAADEDRWVGAYTYWDNTAEGRLTRRWAATVTPNENEGTDLRWNPGGLAGVWAEENTRDSIFDALRRRETFATSGPRIRVRFFGGWGYPSNLHTRASLVADAYQDGVPMGGNLAPQPPGSSSPRFVVWATKDPSGANLQKVQIVKGWTEGGKAMEEVYDVACANGVKPDERTRRCAAARLSVSLSDCALNRPDGARELSVTWTDPKFNPAERAFFYARVLEIPTCRWSTHDARALDRTLHPAVPALTQERAWSSPVWYTPTMR